MSETPKYYDQLHVERAYDTNSVITADGEVTLRRSRESIQPSDVLLNTLESGGLFSGQGFHTNLLPVSYRSVTNTRQALEGALNGTNENFPYTPQDITGGNPRALRQLAAYETVYRPDTESHDDIVAFLTSLNEQLSQEQAGSLLPPFVVSLMGLRWEDFDEAEVPNLHLTELQGSKFLIEDASSLQRSLKRGLRNLLNPIPDQV